MRKIIIIILITVICFSGYSLGKSENNVLIDKVPEKNIDKSLPVSGFKGSVIIKNNLGSIYVFGWEKDEVRVQGTLGKYIEAFNFENKGSHILIEVQIPKGDLTEAYNEMDTDLEVSIPYNSSVVAKSLGADIYVGGVEGIIHCRSTLGNISVSDDINKIESIINENSIKETELPHDSAKRKIIISDKSPDDFNFDLTIDELRLKLSDFSDRGKELFGIDNELLKESEIYLSSLSGNVFFDWDLKSKKDIILINNLGNIDLILPKEVEALFTIETSFDRSVNLTDFTTAFPKELIRIGPEKTGNDNMITPNKGRKAVTDGEGRYALLLNQIVFKTGSGESSIYLRSSLFGNLNLKTK